MSNSIFDCAGDWLISLKRRKIECKNVAGKRLVNDPGNRITNASALTDEQRPMGFALRR